MRENHISGRGRGEPGCARARARPPVRFRGRAMIDGPLSKVGDALLMAFGMFWDVGWMPQQTFLLSPPQVPEHREALHHAGQIVPIGSRVEILPDRQIGDVLKGLALDLLRLALWVRGVHPAHSQGFQRRAVWPAGRRRGT